MKRYNGEPTREVYPDATLPGWLRDIRDGKTSTATARAAAIYGAELRTRKIAAERLDADEADLRGEGEAVREMRNEVWPEDLAR